MGDNTPPQTTDDIELLIINRPPRIITCTRYSHTTLTQTIGIRTVSTVTALSSHISHSLVTHLSSSIINRITHQSHTLRISHHSSLLPHHHHYHQHYLTLPPTHHSSLSLSSQHHHYIYHLISQTEITHTH
jgi:hypothetical protein